MLAFVQGNASCATTTVIASTASVSVSTSSNSGSYTVQTGDTLSDIARQFNVSVNQLVTANNIANPNLIAAGQVLAIPS